MAVDRTSGATAEQLLIGIGGKSYPPFWDIPLRSETYVVARSSPVAAGDGK